MTKGPVGVVLPVVILLIYHFVCKDLKVALRFYKLWRGLAIVCAIALPWFVIEITATHGDYFRSFILRENFQRFTAVVDSHHGSWWYHLAAVSVGFFPWIVFIPQSLVRAFANAGRDLAKGVQPEGDLLKSNLLLFSAVAAVCVVVFFSASTSKLLPYTLPAFPALACLLALELDYVFGQQAWRRLVAPISILLVAFSSAGLLLPKILPHLKHVPEVLLADINACVAFQTLLMMVVLALLLLHKNKKAAVVFLLLAQTSAFAYFGSNVAAKVSALWEGPIPVLSRMAAASGEPIFVYKMRKVSVPFYARRATAMSPNQEFLTSTLEQELPKYPRACIIASVFDSKSFADAAHFKVMKWLGDYMLIEWTR
jgi:hypothetical protein